MARAGASRPAGASAPGVEVILFRLGKARFLAPRGEVLSFRHSPRVRLTQEGHRGSEGLAVISLSDLLELGRDTSVDRRVLEVEHWGARLGLEVTGIEGIRTVRPSQLHPLPPLVERGCTSHALLGLAWIEGGWAIALDLGRLLVERGVEVPEAAGSEVNGGAP